MRLGQFVTRFVPVSADTQGDQNFFLMSRKTFLAEKAPGKLVSSGDNEKTKRSLQCIPEAGFGYPLVLGQ